VHQKEEEFYLKALQHHRIEVYTKHSPLVSRIWNQQQQEQGRHLSDYEVSLVEKELAYSSRVFLGTRSSTWSQVVALMRLSRKSKEVLPGL
jgi:hypothetical protein